MWPYPRHNLALTYAESGDYAAAKREYLEAIATAPKQAYLYYNLGLVYERSNQKRLARRAYEDALRSLTEQAAIYDSRNSEWEVAILEQRDKGDAGQMDELRREADLTRKRSTAALKTTAIVENALGSLLESERNPPAAAGHYEAAIRIDSSFCVARHNLAMLKQKWPRKNWKGNSDSPEALYRQNVSLCPAFWPSVLQVAAIDFSNGDLSKARGELDTVLSQAPENREAKKKLASVLILQNETSTAIQMLTKAIDQDPEGDASKSGHADPTLYELLGDAYTASKDPKACEAYRSAIAAAKWAAYSGDRARLRRKANCR